MNETLTPPDDGSDDIERIQYEKHKEVIETLLAAGALAQAKQYDERFKVGWFKKITKTQRWLDQFITLDPEMIELKEVVAKLAAPEINDPVLIIGDTGTGKELLAKALHGDKQGNFVEINCAGMPDQLIESELFGHSKGAFTGADKDSIGLIELAAQDAKGNPARGTLFLDEIGELNINVQAKLLRVLNDKRLRKVGGKTTIPVDFRLVSATHCAIGQGDNSKFRTDLYYRISTFELKTTPLISRREDILEIVKVLAPDLLKDKLKHGVFLEHLRARDYKGNVRELQSLVRRYQILGK